MKKRIIGLIGLMVLTANLFAGQIFYVTETGMGNMDGSSWANAYADVQTAIDAAESVGGGEVWIAKGTYKHGSAMTMKNSVAIYGGFAGTETSKEERVSGNNTILDGEGKYRVFYNKYTEANPLTNSAKLDNVTIRNGYVSGSGAGMYNYYASPEITNCTFSNNTGGGMYNSSSSSPVLTNCTFSGNSASSYGGGMYNSSSSSPVLTNCTFSNNTGGGMYNSSSSPVLTNCTFSNNRASDGGGMYNSSSSSPVLTNCTFSNNSARSSSGEGGGMYNFSSSSPVLTNCTFSGNSASGSSYSYGGGMYNSSSSSPVLTNCTFSGNSASSYGGGMYNSSSSSPSLTNCILWGNTSSYIDNEIYNNDTYCKLTIDTCIIKGGYNSSGTYKNIITVDPKLLPLGNYGGSVQTCPVGPSDSSAVRLGKVLKDVSTDARGLKRSTIAPTIGAYEYIEPKLTAQFFDSTFNIGKIVSFSVSAKSDAGEVKYQWQKLNSNREWENINGATSSTYKISNCQADLDNTKYRCVISNVCDGVSITSAEVTLAENKTITSASLHTAQSTINNGGYAYLKASHDASEPTFKWYVSTDYGTTYTEIESETSSTLEFAVDSSMDRYLYKCAVTSKNGTTIETTPSVLIINDSAIAISKDIADKVVLKGESATFEVIATAESNLTYQWQVSSDKGATWYNLENETASTLSLSITDHSLDGNYYRLKIDNGCGYIYSKSARLTVYRYTTITEQPVNSYTFEGNTATFSVGVDYSGVLTYQWQEKVDGAWVIVDGATDSTLRIVDMQESYNGRTFRCVITNGNISKLSDEAVLTLATDATITTQPSSIDVAYIGKQAVFSVEVSGYNLTYQWYVIGGYGTQSAQAIEGATSSTLTIDVDENILQNTYYCVINDTKNTLTTSKVSVGSVKEAVAFTLTVENGTGSGTYEADDEITIVANEAQDGMVFDKWVGDVENVADVSASTTTIKMPAKNATVTATYVEKPVVDPFGDAVVYPNVAMTILGEVDLFGSPANSGCVVAAYVGNELRGKSSVVDISGRSLVNLTVNVNANGEEIKFKIWTPSDGRIIDARADCTAVSASGDSIGSLDSPFAIVFANNLNLELLLKEGWNQVSFNVGLENMAVRTILSDVIDNVALVQGRGTSFNPSWPDSLNTLKSFDNTSGFWVKMNAAASVSLTGSALDVSAKTISLNVGWNNIGYTPATAASIRTVLATALADGKIERIINSKGNFNPATPDVLNSLKTMTPGEGYWVKTNAATTIAYDKIITAKRAMLKSRAVIFAANSASENFGEPVVYPNVQMTILANVLVNGAAAPSGSVVAAFVDGELRAKQEIVSLDGKSIANLTVSVAKNGETIGFKIWNSATGETLDFATTVAAESGAAPYTYPDNLLELSASGTPSVGGDTEPAEPVVYPNTPMSLYVEVQIDGKTVSDGDIIAAYVGDELRGKQTVVIYDGKAIANLVVNVASNGEKIAFKVWDASAKRLYTATTTINAEIGGEPYSYPDNLLIVNAQTATGGFALWTSKNGLSGYNANALATPFNDGISNIEKFAFGLSGNKAASYSENALFKQSYADGKACFQFPISKYAVDSVSVKVMTSEDLVNWVEVPSSNIGESSDFNLMQTEQPIPEGGKLFFKLIVEEK